MKHVEAAQMARLHSITSCVFQRGELCSYLGNVNAVDTKTSGRTFGTVTMMMMVMMMAVSAEVVLSKEDPVA